MRRSPFTRGQYVYAVRRQNGDVKIGQTMNFIVRMALLRRQYGPIKILATLPGDRGLEAEIHERLASARIRPPHPGPRGGSKMSDWFRPTEEVLRFVREEMDPYTYVPVRKPRYKYEWADDSDGAIP